MRSLAFREYRNAVVDSPVELLDDQILLTTAASVSFVVPTGYGILLLKWSDVYGDDAALRSMNLTFNSDTGGNYDYSRQLFGDASSTVNAQTEISIGVMADTDGVEDHSSGILIILNRTSQEKVTIGHDVQVRKAGASAEDLFGVHSEGKWRNTSDEIASLTVTPAVGNFAANSRFILLGVKI